jgi:hypothetical protein
MWLNDYFINHNLFPDGYTVYRDDEGCSNYTASPGGGALIALCQSVAGFKRRLDLELINECVWIEITILDGFSFQSLPGSFTPM